MHLVDLICLMWRQMTPILVIFIDYRPNITCGQCTFYHWCHTSATDYILNHTFTGHLTPLADGLSCGSLLKDKSQPIIYLISDIQHRMTVCVHLRICAVASVCVDVCVVVLSMLLLLLPPPPLHLDQLQNYVCPQEYYIYSITAPGVISIKPQPWDKHFPTCDVFVKLGSNVFVTKMTRDYRQAGIYVENRFETAQESLLFYQPNLTFSLREEYVSLAKVRTFHH